LLPSFSAAPGSLTFGACFGQTFVIRKSAKTTYSTASAIASSIAISSTSRTSAIYFPFPGFLGNYVKFPVHAFVILATLARLAYSACMLPAGGLKALLLFCENFELFYSDKSG